MIVLQEAIKAAHTRARARGGDDKVLNKMDLFRFRNGHYGTVYRLVRITCSQRIVRGWHT